MTDNYPPVMGFAILLGAGVVGLAACNSLDLNLYSPLEPCSARRKPTTLYIGHMSVFLGCDERDQQEIKQRTIERLRPRTTERARFQRAACLTAINLPERDKALESYQRRDHPKF